MHGTTDDSQTVFIFSFSKLFLNKIFKIESNSENKIIKGVCIPFLKVIF